MQAVIQAVMNFIRMLRITDLIDIAILSFVIYKLIWATRKNSFGRVLKGVGLVLLIMFLSTAFKLYAVSFLFNIIVEWGVLALVILFQPEIRRVLERMGNTRLFKMFESSKEKDLDSVEIAIEQTVDAYTSMSDDKVGALIVFERRDHLDDAIKTGTTLDAALSSELVKNIFWNKAPLHDGAVIVRDGRIIAAGCMLPLSANVNLSRELGMRHRAGIGMSEQSDAVVAVVSEETGSISVAVGGMLKRHLAPETLDRLLRNELLVEDENPQESVSILGLLSSLWNKAKRGEEQNEADN